MRFDTIKDVPGYDAAIYLADEFELKYPVARAVVNACREAYEAGKQGEPCPVPVASEDLRDLVEDAWHDGITRKDRVTVVLTNSGDAACECGACFPDLEATEDREPCEDCGSTAYSRQVVATVHASYAREWADWDQTIEGSSWECDGEHFAYSIIPNRPGLVRDLIAEGYEVDASNLDEVES